MSPTMPASYPKALEDPPMPLVHQVADRCDDQRGRARFGHRRQGDLRLARAGGHDDLAAAIGLPPRVQRRGLLGPEGRQIHLRPAPRAAARERRSAKRRRTAASKCRARRHSAAHQPATRSRGRPMSRRRIPKGRGLPRRPGRPEAACPGRRTGAAPCWQWDWPPVGLYYIKRCPQPRCAAAWYYNAMCRMKRVSGKRRIRHTPGQTDLSPFAPGENRLGHGLIPTHSRPPKSGARDGPRRRCPPSGRPTVWSRGRRTRHTQQTPNRTPMVPNTRVPTSPSRR